LVNQSRGISGLQPEIARTITGGLDYRRKDPGGWAGSATWFRTVFDNRVATPLDLASSGNPTTDIFAPPALAPYVSRSIDLTQIQAIFASPYFAEDFVGSGAAGVRATFDNELTNIARSLEEGVEVSLRYCAGERPKQLSAFLIGNYLLRDTYRLTPGAPMASLANNIGQSPNLRARGGVAGFWKDWRVTLNVNYTNGYHNALVIPEPSVGSWTTADFQLAWQIPAPTAPVIHLSFNARNVLNTRPPWVFVPAGKSLRPVGFDATNASVLGRMLSMELSVTW
jgi:iron complex outermembrane recepter protein